MRPCPRARCGPRPVRRRPMRRGRSDPQLRLGGLASRSDGPDPDATRDSGWAPGSPLQVDILERPSRGPGFVAELVGILGPDPHREEVNAVLPAPLDPGPGDLGHGEAPAPPPKAERLDPPL